MLIILSSLFIYSVVIFVLIQYILTDYVDLSKPFSLDLNESVINLLIDYETWTMFFTFPSAHYLMIINYGLILLIFVIRFLRMGINEDIGLNLDFGWSAFFFLLASPIILVPLTVVFYKVLGFAYDYNEIILVGGPLPVMIFHMVFILTAALEECDFRKTFGFNSEMFFWILAFMGLELLLMQDRSAMHLDWHQIFVFGSIFVGFVFIKIIFNWQWLTTRD